MTEKRKVGFGVGKAYLTTPMVKKNMMVIGRADGTMEKENCTMKMGEDGKGK